MLNKGWQLNKQHGINTQEGQKLDIALRTILNNYPTKLDRIFPTGHGTHFSVHRYCPDMPSTQTHV